MKEDEECFKCPIGQKIASYQEASLDAFLARQLALKQGIPGHPDEVLMDHYKRHAETFLELACKCCRASILCRSYHDRNPS